MRTSKIPPTSATPERGFPVLYGLFVALCLSIFGMIAVIWLAQADDMTDGKIVVGSYIVHGLATFVGAFVASRRAKHREGWYVGGITGLLYSCVMTAIGFASFQTFTLDADGMFRILLMTVLASFAGVLGKSSTREPTR
jgi:putative membrane protein (TIGR04086 family)